MSVLTFAFSGANVARPLFSLRIFAILVFMFKAFTTNLVSAAQFVLKPRQPLEQSKRRDNLYSVSILDRMAKELDSTQPSVAAELRLLAASR